MPPAQPAVAGGPSEFLRSLRRGLLLGAAVLALILPPAVMHFGSSGLALALPRVVPRHASFGNEAASPEVRHMADWVVTSRDNGPMSFVIVDKKQAKVFLFDPAGRMTASAPALLGAARGDDTVPGIGNKPINQVLPEEKTTPAGRFVAHLGMSSTRREDVVWVDYEAAVSMHRVIKVRERLEGLKSPRPDDKRMSFGCINLPDAFYEKSLRPSVRSGAVIYILPETRDLRETFTAYYDVPAPLKYAQH